MFWTSWRHHNVPTRHDGPEPLGPPHEVSGEEVVGVPEVNSDEHQPE